MADFKRPFILATATISLVFFYHPDNAQALQITFNNLVGTLSSKTITDGGVGDLNTTANRIQFTNLSLLVNDQDETNQTVSTSGLLIAKEFNYNNFTPDGKPLNGSANGVILDLTDFSLKNLSTTTTLDLRNSTNFIDIRHIFSGLSFGETEPLGYLVFSGNFNATGTNTASSTATAEVQVTGYEIQTVTTTRTTNLISDFTVSKNAFVPTSAPFPGGTSTVQGLLGKLLLRPGETLNLPNSFCTAVINYNPDMPGQTLDQSQIDSICDTASASLPESSSVFSLLGFGTLLGLGSLLKPKDK